MVKLDTDIKRDIELELKWDPDIDATDITVSAKNGVVTVTGFVPKYTQKHDAERDAERVAGVVGLANDIEVRLPVIDQRPDPEIARDVVAGIEKALPFSSKRIKALVGNGWITLEGEVEWNFQRERAESAVRRVKGITGVSNLISFKPTVAPSDVRRKIEAAFKRSAEIDASNITVEAADGKVTLRGTVRSCAERQEAERAVWVAPRFTKVDNKITIDTSLSAESARRDSLSSVT